MWETMEPQAPREATHPKVDACCEMCRCPWEGYESARDAQQWRKDDWLAAFEGEDAHPDKREWAWDLLKGYIEDSWSRFLEEFWYEERNGNGGEGVIPRSVEQMKERLLADGGVDIWVCRACDLADGSRNGPWYRSAGP